MSVAPIRYLLADAGGSYPTANLGRLAFAVAPYLAQLAAAWGQPAPFVAPKGASFPLDGARIVEVAFVPKVDVEGALAYHTIVNGVARCEVGAPAGQANADTEEGTAHELGEALCDFDCSQTRPWPGGGTVDLEVCDPLQGCRRLVDLGDGGPAITVPDFALPGWFGMGLGAFSLLGFAPAARWVAPGGYLMGDDASGQEVQLGMVQAPASKFGPGSRIGHRRRRGVTS